MSYIKTEYRGHEILYNENTDEWTCYDIDYRGPALSKVRARIDKMYLELRKTAAVGCFLLDGGNWSAPSAIPATVVEYLGDQRTFSGFKQPATKVAVVSKSRGSGKSARSHTELDRLMPDTPEAHEALRAAEEAFARLKDAKAAYDAAYAAVPRLTVDDVQGLKRIKDSESP